MSANNLLSPPTLLLQSLTAYQLHAWRDQDYCVITHIPMNSPAAPCTLHFESHIKQTAGAARHVAPVRVTPSLIPLTHSVDHTAAAAHILSACGGSVRLQV
jgi:hypothetical protein